MGIEQYFGEARYGNSRSDFTKYISLDPKKPPVEGVIVPPIRDLAVSGTWHVWHACHWGYSVPRIDDPLRTLYRPFKCLLRTDQSKMVTHGCDECALIERTEKQLKEAQETWEEQGKSEEEVKALLAAMKGSRHNRDCKHYINFKLLDGSFIVLLLSGRTLNNVLKPKIEAVKVEYGVDSPINAGVVFRFAASGFGGNRVDSVEPILEREEVSLPNGGKKVMSSLKLLPWTEAAAAEAARKGIDLKNPDRFVTLSDDQVRLLAECSGDPEDVQRIMSIGSPAPRQHQQAAPEPPRQAPKAQEVVQPPKAPKAQPERSQAASMASSAAERKAKLMAELAALEAEEAAPAKQVSVPVGGETIEMDPEQFAALILSRNNDE